ncbi:MAG: DUF1326 domain-containing protein [Acidobacteriota bacterium]|jgi:hypothetical protein|nr:DUF1326 domain-containing protein [Acidobacteriota bacterium]MDQ3420455.1 DUF1326 domain-containing protein [Acidobacteriota bacterium]
MTTETLTRWALKGRGYEYCNCDFGCGCNFGGFPNSKDGSCHALVGMEITSGRCGDVDLSNVTCAAVVAWPKAIHEGNGKCVFVVRPETTDEQVGALAQVLSGKLGGMPWELLGPTMEVVALHKVPITIEGEGRKSTFTIEGIGAGRGGTFKNPVTGEEHLANVDLPDGFIWKLGQCGQGSFEASSDGVSVKGDKSNWIFYEFDWSNA